MIPPGTPGIILPGAEAAVVAASPEAAVVVVVGAAVVVVGAGAAVVVAAGAAVVASWQNRGRIGSGSRQFEPPKKGRNLDSSSGTGTADTSPTAINNTGTIFIFQ